MRSLESEAVVPLKGVVAFLALVFGLTWLPAWALSGTRLGGGEPLVTRLLSCSLFYALCMGWQPLVAAWIVRRWIDPPGYLDHGLTFAAPRFVVLAGVAALALAALAWGTAALAAHLGAPELPLALDRPLPPEPAVWPSLNGALELELASVAALGLLMAQSFVEEIGWRGFLLARLMQRLGP